MSGDSNFGKITEAELNKCRARLGKPFEIKEPYIRDINWDNIRHASRGSGNVNPLYNDPDYASGTRYGKLIAPTCLLYGVGWGSWDMRKGMGLPGVHSVHSGDHYILYKPFYDGDKVKGTKEFESIVKKPGNFSGAEQYVQTILIKFYNQNEEVCAVNHMPIFRAEASKAKKKGRDKKIERASYTREEIAEMDERMSKELIRGSETRYWEDVEIGESVPEFIRGLLCTQDQILWLAGMGQNMLRTGQFWLQYRKQTGLFSYDSVTGVPESLERLHYDANQAATVGQPGAYDYGAARGGHAMTYITNWTGDDGWMCDIEFQFRGFLYFADYLIITGKVTDKWRGAKTGTGYVEITFESVDQRGRNMMPGKAIVALPSQVNGAVEFPVDVHADGKA